MGERINNQSEEFFQEESEKRKRLETYQENEGKSFYKVFSAVDFTLKKVGENNLVLEAIKIAFTEEQMDRLVDLKRNTPIFIHEIKRIIITKEQRDAVLEKLKKDIEDRINVIK